MRNTKKIEISLKKINSKSWRLRCPHTLAHPPPQVKIVPYTHGVGPELLTRAGVQAIDLGVYTAHIYAPVCHSWGRSPDTPRGEVLEESACGGILAINFIFQVRKDISVKRIYFTDQFNGWAIGDRGAIFYTNASGWTCKNQSIPMAFNLEDIYFLNNSIGWICGDNGTVLHTLNGGQSWTSLSNSSLKVDFHGIFFQNTTNGLAVGSAPELYTSSNGGNFWQVHQLTMFSFNNSWVWVLISLDIVFLAAGPWSINNFDKIKRIKIIQSFKSSLNKVEAFLFNTQTIGNKISVVILITGLFYVFHLVSILIHELGHAFATLLLGSYTNYIEVNLNLSGTTHTAYNLPFNLYAIILLASSGIISAIITGIVLMKISLQFIKRNKRFFTLLALIISYSFIIANLIYFIVTPFFTIYSDASELSFFLNIPIYVIPLLLLPAFIVSLFFILKILLNFYKTSLYSNKSSLYLLLVSFSLFVGLYYFIFPFTGNLFTIVIS